MSRGSYGAISGAKIAVKTNSVDEPEADDRSGVADQASPGIAPQPARGLELDLRAFELGD